MQLTVLGETLISCCLSPMTGWQRDGLCSFDEADKGLHIVCAKMTKEFLDYSKQQGNNLTTPNEYFPGLKPGDKWCLCFNRWLEAFHANLAPPIFLKSTNIKVLNYVPLPILKQHACDL